MLWVGIGQTIPYLEGTLIFKCINIFTYILAYWLVMVIMTSAGYADMNPTTIPARIITAIVMIAGFTITALPIAIVGGNFAVVHAYNQKRGERIKQKSRT